jgi:hypothetical protein
MIEYKPFKTFSVSILVGAIKDESSLIKKPECSDKLIQLTRQPAQMPEVLCDRA